MSQYFLRVLTLNSSWAIQAGVEAGSEADFVRECNRRMKKCFDDQISLLGEVGKVDLACFQEVEAVDFEERVKRRQPSLTGRERACVWNASVKKAIFLSTMWDTDVLEKTRTVSFDLEEMHETGGGGRPCHVVEFRVKGSKKFLLLIHVHFPWISKRETVDDIVSFIRSRLPKEAEARAERILLVGDTNDAKTHISSDTPIRIGRKVLHCNMTKRELRKKLLTCCWHEEGHKYASLSDTGDYVLSDDRRMVAYVPDAFEKQRGNAFASDHMPVMGEVRV